MQVLNAVKNGTKVLMVVCKGLPVWKEPIINGRQQLWHGVIVDNSRLDSENIVTVSWGESDRTDELITDLRVSL